MELTYNSRNLWIVVHAKQCKVGNFISRSSDFFFMLKINYADKNDHVREFYAWNCGWFVCLLIFGNFDGISQSTLDLYKNTID